ncbi:MAG: hypothetical protein AABM29_02770 [Actinomycetota bacterium]
MAAVVGLGLALILTTGGDDSETTTTETGTQIEIGTGTETETETVTTTIPPQDVAEIRSPTGNIVCRVASEEARCAILEFAYAPPPKPASCDLPGWGHTLGVGTVGEGAFVCSGNPPASLQSKVLRYGYVLRLGPFECDSSSLALLCENRETGHGFLVSRDRYRTY